MPANPKAAGATVIPSHRCKDALAAVEFLCKAFGFEKMAVHAMDDGTIAHAQLTFGNGMLMLGSHRDSDHDHIVRPPEGLDRINTQSCYVIVTDVDAHHDHAKAAGAEIVTKPEDQPYGGRLFSCRDPEGHLWNFGSYDPWAEA